MGKSLVQQLIAKRDKEQKNLADKIHLWHNDFLWWAWWLMMIRMMMLSVVMLVIPFHASWHFQNQIHCWIKDPQASEQQDREEETNCCNCCDPTAKDFATGPIHGIQLDGLTWWVFRGCGTKRAVVQHVSILFLIWNCHSNNHSASLVAKGPLSSTQTGFRAGDSQLHYPNLWPSLNLWPWALSCTFTIACSGDGPRRFSFVVVASLGRTTARKG